MHPSQCAMLICHSIFNIISFMLIRHILLEESILNLIKSYTCLMQCSHNLNCYSIKIAEREIDSQNKNVKRIDHE